MLLAFLCSNIQSNSNLLTESQTPTRRGLVTTVRGTFLRPARLASHSGRDRKWSRSSDKGRCKSHCVAPSGVAILFVGRRSWPVRNLFQARRPEVPWVLAGARAAAEAAALCACPGAGDPLPPHRAPGRALRRAQGAAQAG